MRFLYGVDMLSLTRCVRQSSHLEIERLQSQIRKLRVQTRTSIPLEASVEAGEEPTRLTAGEAVGARAASFSERVTEDKLLRSLYVETKTPWDHNQLLKERMSSPVTTGRSYLKEKVQCRLSLDSAALASVSSGRPTASSPALRRSGSVEDEITQRVGRICSEIVANCCYVLDVKAIGKLPRYVEKVHRLAHLSSTYLAFVERLEKLLKQYNLVRFLCFGAMKV
ncbi:hypothetical protein BBJ28_00022652 [Nothophytophthora sp. Chile5]|nr:hypothetical protein BBJ28_00022652 [Nothophytophthora sp. Chile5]